MPTVLIVDDNAVDRQLAAGLIQSAGIQTCFAEHGKAAVAVLESEHPPDLVVTDMQMPEMDGLELVEWIKAHHPTIPVVLMTAHGSEEVAVKALRIGAASYVPKQNLNRDLSSTIRDVWGIANVARDEQKARSYLTQADLAFEVGVENAGHEPLVGYLQSQLQAWGILDETDLIRVGTALHEAFVNAIEHGNLELRSGLRDSPDGAYQRLGEERRSTPPFCDRRVYVTAKLTRQEAIITIRDEGPGFNPKNLPDPTIPENIGKISGRGLLLIRTFMDDVKFNDAGTEITLKKRRSEE